MATTTTTPHRHVTRPMSRRIENTLSNEGRRLSPTTRRCWSEAGAPAVIHDVCRCGAHRSTPAVFINGADVAPTGKPGEWK